MSTAPGLSVRDLRVDVEGRVLVSIDALDLPGGACTVLTGPGDSGKTVLALALAGAMPAQGEVRVAGRPCTGPPSARVRQGLAVVAATPLRLQGCSVTEALHLAARRGRRVAAILDRFPLLAARRSLAVERLSGGEHQVLRIACAWAATPDALVLDTPTTGLAGDVAQDVRRLALDEAARGAAVLWLDQPAATVLPAPPALALRDGSVSVTAAVSRRESPTAEA